MQQGNTQKGLPLPPQGPGALLLSMQTPPGPQSLSPLQPFGSRMVMLPPQTG
jgi:hypothetical protein